jgi:hypothetical protein
MSIGSIFLGFALVLLVGLFLARPFLLSQQDQRQRRPARQELVNQKESILALIEILDFDIETGPMPEQDYKQQRRQLLVQAAEILKRLDDYSDIPESPAANRVLDEIETAVAALRGPKVRQPLPSIRPTPTAQPISPAPQQTTAKPASASTNGRVKFCSQCGKPVEEDDKFCAYCGHKVIHA